MRIRKRFLCLSAAITAPPSSDLHGGNHNHRQQPLLTRVQHQELLHPNHSHRPLPPSSSHPTTQIGLQQPSTCVSSDPNKTKIFKELETERKKELIKTTDDYDYRKESILCAEANNHDLVLNGWLDQVVPVKKRRGSHGRRLSNDVIVQEDNEMNEQETKKTINNPEENDNNRVVKMKEKREGTVMIMEGSRCSRVNGRGWRCSQQTLVGYSLCEHHLGKGRLRSMTRVRGRAQCTVALKEKRVKERNDNLDDNDDDVEDEEFKEWDMESTSSMEGTKVKKTKHGVVKARSLSSLLSQISSS